MIDSFAKQCDHIVAGQHVLCIQDSSEINSLASIKVLQQASKITIVEDREGNNPQAEQM